jgi:hypothetical protein
MALTYNKVSNHIKQDGAVVGIVKQIDGQYVFAHYKFAGAIKCHAKTLDALLPKIKKVLAK